MIETALALPFIGMFMMLVMFLGLQMLNQQDLRESARYNTWRYMGTHGSAGDVELNRLFFAGKALGVSQSRQVRTVTDVEQTLKEYTTEVSNLDATAGQLADTLVNLQLHPQWADSVTANFPNEIGLLREFGPDGEMNTQYIRSGGDWRRGQVREGAQVTAVLPSDAVREQFLIPLDDAMQRVASPGNTLADAARHIYVQGW
jgi:hypothetical protein